MQDLQKLLEFFTTPGNQNLTALNNGRYRLIKRLGSGAFGAVFLATDTVLSREVAIKQVIPTQSSQVIPKEVDILLQLKKHPMLPELYEAFYEVISIDALVLGIIHAEYLFIVMEFIDAVPLLNGTQMKDGTYYPRDEVIDIGIKLCKVITYLHTKNAQKSCIIHRDIKPNNILRRQSDGRIWLVDFGLARNHKTGLLIDSTTRRGVGHAFYMPSEQLGNAQTKPCSDIYALGVTLFHLFTGEKLDSYDPLFGGKPYKLIPQLMHGQHLPKRLELLINKMMEQRMENRPQSATEVRIELEKVRDELKPPPTPNVQPQPLPLPQQSVISPSVVLPQQPTNPQAQVAPIAPVKNPVQSRSKIRTVIETTILYAVWGILSLLLGFVLYKLVTSIKVPAFIVSGGSVPIFTLLGFIIVVLVPGGLMIFALDLGEAISKKSFNKFLNKTFLKNIGFYSSIGSLTFIFLVSGSLGAAYLLYNLGIYKQISPVLIEIINIAIILVFTIMIVLIYLFISEKLKKK